MTVDEWLIIKSFDFVFLKIGEGGIDMAKKLIIPMQYPKHRNELDTYLRSATKEFKIDSQIKIIDDIYSELAKPIYENISKKETIRIASVVIQSLVAGQQYAKKRKRKKRKKT